MEKIDKKIDTLNCFFRKKRDSLFLPITKIFYKFKISPNFLSISKIFFAFLYIYFIKTNFFLAITFLLGGGVLIDFFDGPLARYSGAANDRGKFIDMFSDQMVYVLAILGLIIINISTPAILSYNLIIVSALYLIIIIDKNENKTTDWIIKPIARANYYKLILEISVVLHIFLKMPELIFNRLIIITNSIITIHFIYHLINFSQRKKLKIIN
jgi:phosphatidylglycerophosphate synthase